MTASTYWLIIGFVGQGIFTARFLVQWIASEKKRDSVVPIAFWWLSLLGGFNLLAYAIYRRDPVIILGQSMGMLVYVRNLMLIMKGRRKAARRAAASGVLPKGPHRATGDRRAVAGREGSAG